MPLAQSFHSTIKSSLDLEVIKKAIKKAILRVDLDDTIMVKVSKKSIKVIRRVYKEVILSKYLINPIN